MYELSASVSSPDPLFTLNNYLLYKSCVFPYLVADVGNPIPDKLPELSAADFIGFFNAQNNFIRNLLLIVLNRYSEK